MLAGIGAVSGGAPPGYAITSVLSLTVGVILTTLSPTLQEIGRPRPRLTMAATGALETDATRLTAPAMRPWPIDAGRIVDNEVRDAEATLRLGDSPLGIRASLSDPFAHRPSPAEHEKAREAFRQTLSDYAAELRQWLGDYEAAAREHSEIFDVALALSNGPGAAHAESVVIIIDLRSAVAAVETRPTVSCPPERPYYIPPQPKLSRELMFVDRPTVRGVIPTLVLPLDGAQARTWEVSGDGRQLRASIGDLHPARSVLVGETLLLRAAGEGTHKLRWQAFSKGARQPTSGTLELVVPPDPLRPPLGRLRGVTSYPDAPLVEDDGKVVHPARTADPPSRPDTAIQATDVFKRMRAAHKLLEWAQLGLDPSDDGPEGKAA